MIIGHCVNDWRLPLIYAWHMPLFFIVSGYFFPASAAFGRKRQQQICHARNVSIYIIKKSTDLSYPSIGKMFGRDHSTIISSYDAIKGDLDKNTLLGIEINEIIKELNE